MQHQVPTPTTRIRHTWLDRIKDVMWAVIAAIAAAAANFAFPEASAWLVNFLSLIIGYALALFA